MMLNIDTQLAFDLVLAVFGVVAPIAIVYALLSRAFRGFVDMVTGRDNISL